MALESKNVSCKTDKLAYYFFGRNRGKQKTSRPGAGREAGGLQEHILQHEQHCQHIHQRLDRLALAGGNVQQNVADDAEANALGDGVEQGHGDDGQVCGDGLGQVVQLEADLADGAVLYLIWF